MKKYFQGISLALIISQSQSLAQTNHQKTYGNSDIYFTMSLTYGQLRNNSQGFLNTNFNYSVTDQNGQSTLHNFNSSWQLPSNIKNPLGGYINFELGNYRSFITISGGGYETASGVFAVGVGHNFYLPIHCHSKFLDSQCLTIKTSLSLGMSQSAQFNRNGNDNSYEVGQIDNQNKTIEALGFKFYPTYSVSSSNNQPPTNVSAKNLDVYFLENNTLLLPKISIGKNNYERLFYVSIDIGYYIPLVKKRALQLYQNEAYSGKTLWLDSHSDTMNYDGQPLSSMPSVVNGLVIGATIGINFSREIFESYGTKNLHKHSADYSMVCHCHDGHAHHQLKSNSRRRSKNTKLKSKKKSRPNGEIKNEPNTRGW